MRHVFLTIFTFLTVLTLPSATALAAGKAEHVVVVVWDGLRPDSVNEANTPTLFHLARNGVFFQNHHSVYISSTEVNGVALATGALPNRNGVVANREYRPAIDPLKRIEIESMDTIVKGDQVSDRRYLQMPTLPELLRRAGRKVAVAGTKPVALLFDRFERDKVRLSTASKFDTPNVKEDAATTRALIDLLWTNGVPAFSLLWLSDPDTTQHATASGSPKSSEALKSVDANLALVLKQLETNGVRDVTDVFVVSDHGFSTVARTIDVADELKKGGFSAAREFKEPPATGDIMVVGNGGSVLLYVIGRDKALTQRLVEFLQQQDWPGVIFTRQPMTGAFTLNQARLDSTEAPDILISLRWTNETNQFGVAGAIVSDGSTYGKMSVGLGRGGHSSLSPFDMRATLVAAGPDFRRGMVNQLPSGNADLAPTILHLLDIKPPQPMDGRLLFEALNVGLTRVPPIETKTIEASCQLPKGLWRQYLRVTEFSGAVYFDDGNGSFAQK